LHTPLADPQPVAVAIAALPVSQGDAVQRRQAVRAERERINTLTDETGKQARQAINRQTRELVLDTERRHLLRALYSPGQCASR
jgi:hypothetical protein